MCKWNKSVYNMFTKYDSLSGDMLKSKIIATIVNIRCLLILRDYIP